MPDLGKLYSIVPAAGRSSRMGEPKLLLPFGSERLIDRLLRAWTASGVHEVIVVARNSDHALAEAARAWPVHVVQPCHDPEDMTASIRCGVDYITATLQPADEDACFLAPADLPGLTSDLIDRVAVEWSDDNRVVVPQFGGRSGHPLLFPWKSITTVIQGNWPDGLRSALHQCDIKAVPLNEADRPADINTPDEYKKALSPR